MKIIKLPLIVCCLLGAGNLYSQVIKLDKNTLETSQVLMSVEKIMGKDAVKVIHDSTVKGSDQPTYARLKSIAFKNGTIEVSLLSRLLPNAPAFARGFIGVAFRINDNNSKFESFYVRPTNGRIDDPVRKIHATQYFSFPDYSFDRLRKDAPGKYESAADIGLNEWIKLTIVVKDAQAKLYINDNKEPALVVNDLKHGANTSGTVGLWVGEWTEGFFSDVRITKE
jgi:hypothetical protein